jgi:hypothetical protein
MGHAMSLTSVAAARAGLGPLAPALIPVLVLILGLDAFCLINIARSKSVRNAPKLAWVIVILAVSAPIGALSAVPSAAALAAAVKGLNARESLTLDRAHRGVADAHG